MAIALETGISRSAAAREARAIKQRRGNHRLPRHRPNRGIPGSWGESEPFDRDRRFAATYYRGQPPMGGGGGLEFGKT